MQVGFGKGTPSKMLWVDGIDPNLSESLLERQMSKYGKVSKTAYNMTSPNWIAIGLMN